MYNKPLNIDQLDMDLCFITFRHVLFLVSYLDGYRLKYNWSGIEFESEMYLN